MRLRTLVGSLLRSRGYHVFRGEHLDKANLSLHLRRIFETQNIDCVFDVGANRGQYYDFLRAAVGYTGRVVSVEPVSRLHRLLQLRAEAHDQWTVLGCALGRTPGTAPFNVMRGDQLSSFRTPTTKSTDRFQDSNRVVAVEQVQVRSLDDVYSETLTEYGFDRPYLKIDAQGFDLEVAEGAPDSFGKFVAVQTEASLLPLYAGAPTYEQTLDYYQARGFVPSAFFPVATDQAFRLIDCECVFVNPQLITSTTVRRY